MHSSRMLTARALTIGGGGVYLPGGVPARGVYLPGGIPAWGVYLPAGVPAQVLPLVNRMTDRCKNITLPQTSFAGGKYYLFQKFTLPLFQGFINSSFKSFKVFLYMTLRLQGAFPNL